MPKPYLTKEEVNKAVRGLLGEASRATERLEMGGAVGEEPANTVGAEHPPHTAPGFPHARE
jgi:hypothetical protein